MWQTIKHPRLLLALSPTTLGRRLPQGLVPDSFLQRFVPCVAILGPPSAKRLAADVPPCQVQSARLSSTALGSLAHLVLNGGGHGRGRGILFSKATQQPCVLTGSQPVLE